MKKRRMTGVGRFGGETATSHRTTRSLARNKHTAVRSSTAAAPRTKFLRLRPKAATDSELVGRATEEMPL